MAIMLDSSNAHAGGGSPIVNQARVYPPSFLEYVWYATLIYAMLGQAWGIVMPLVGGVVWVLVAVGCALTVGTQNRGVYRPIMLALCCGVSMVLIEMIFHEPDERALTEGVAILTWLALLISVQSLCLRPGFLYRFALLALAIALASLPFVSLKGDGKVMRAFAIGTGLSNGNVLGMWFGFCTVFSVFWGFQCQKPFMKIASWIVASGCLYIVALTVSRAPLFAIVLACIVGFRNELKKSFVPILLFTLLLTMVYASGMFDTEIDYYTARGAEKSGRDKLWPAAMERILDSPWVGVGLDNIRILQGTRYVNPHNGPLHIALGAGIFPLICFLGYLARAGIGTLRIMRGFYTQEAALLPPLVVFALIEIMVLDATFMSPWTVVVLGLAARASQVHDGNRSMIT